MTAGDDEVVRLDTETVPPAPPPPSRPSRLHGITITGMALSALVGIASLLAFVTVTWPDGVRRYVVGTLIMSIVGFLTFSAAAVITAARETYVPRGGNERDEG